LRTLLWAQSALALRRWRRAARAALCAPAPRRGARCACAPRAAAMQARASTLRPPHTRGAASVSVVASNAHALLPPHTAGGPPPKREPWDVRRFAKTVLFFNPPPSLLDVLTAPLRMLTGSGGGAKTATPSAASSVPLVFRLDGTPVDEASAAPRVVLVAGATGGVGSRVVSNLLAAGVPVRALVRDVAKARTLLSASDAAHPGLLEVTSGDVAQPATLGGLSGRNARRIGAVVCASSSTVAPKEGDTAARDKYKQGIKFYDPEIVGDTPERVDAAGVRNLLAALAPSLASHANAAADASSDASSVRELGPALFDAASALAGGPGPAWGPLDDVVMGGASSSDFFLDASAGETPGAPAGIFRGRMSTANSGGFASIRTRNFSPPADASAGGAASGLALRLRGDGQRYKLFLRTAPGWDALAYGASFDTSAADGGWQTVRIPFAAFKPIFRAKTVADAPPLDAAAICSLQLMLSKFEYDSQLNPSFAGDGDFALPLSRIAPYADADVVAQKSASQSASQKTQKPFHASWVHISSAGVTRPDRPGIDVAVEPPAVRMNEALGGLLTHKLAGEDAVRGSGLPRHVIIRPVALTEEPPGAELAVDQGDVIKGKISRDDVANLASSLITGSNGCDKVPMGVTFELKSTVPFSMPWTGVTEGGEDVSAAARDWGALLGGVRPGVTGKTVRGVYSGTRAEADVAAEAAAAGASTR
jgi:hypothetical protein